ncbi:MAG TPA: Gfo/Idh/MocA family oxidoreductase [Chthonomonadales bacterium]|nr:Gfo/Idh/MocA family oxidoreductase [Chthonomonadales bacterium]
MSIDTTRRSFLIGAGAAAMALHKPADAQQPAIQGFEQAVTDREAARRWQPVSDRKVRVGIAGYGVCHWGAAFGFQNHPNVVVGAVSDLFPDRCAALARAVGCEKTYPSCEEMIKDDSLEAIFVATCAPSHGPLSVMALRAGKHVAAAVPAVFGSLEEADQLYRAVRSSGRKYMLFETSYFHDDNYAMRELYRGGHLGKLIYAEGEYYHFFPEALASHRGWRTGLPPQWYPTHSNAYYTGVTGLPFTEVSCMGFPSEVEHLKPANNRFRNAFGTEIALMRSSDGAISRMAVSWDTPGDSGEKGRIRAQRGTYYGRFQTYGDPTAVPQPRKPPLPPGVEAGGHGGSHGYLMSEFIEAILMDRKPLVDIGQALTMTVGGIVAHRSARRGGELLKIPQYPF